MAVAVAMVQIRVMRMPVNQARVPVPVRMRFTRHDPRGVLVLMVVIVPVPVLVFHRLVRVFVLVTLREVQPEAQAISPPAMSSLADSGSPSMRTARTAPTKGASEKYAPVRAVPRWRNPRTNMARLTP